MLENEIFELKLESTQTHDLNNNQRVEEEGKLRDDKSMKRKEKTI